MENSIKYRTVLEQQDIFGELMLEMAKRSDKNFGIKQVDILCSLCDAMNGGVLDAMLPVTFMSRTYSNLRYLLACFEIDTVPCDYNEGGYVSLANEIVGDDNYKWN